MDYTELGILAEAYAHAQMSRIALESKIRTGADPLLLASPLAHYAAVEHEMWLALRKAYRKGVSPGIRAWQRETRGLGELVVARVLARIGDPRSRSLPQLWAYCGHGDPARKRHRGMSRAEAAALGNPLAKKLVYDMAYNAMRQGIRNNEGERVALSPYGGLYIERRAATAERIHTTDCPQCLRKAGTPWKDGHSNADALRVLGKRLLKDMRRAG